MPDGRRAASDADILSFGGGARLFECDANPAGHEMKGRAALHDEWSPGMMREDENRLMIHRVIAPPTFPRIIQPGTADGPEHIPAHDPGADIVETPRGKVVIDSGLAVFVSEQVRLKRACRERPPMKSCSADTQRVLPTLVRACAEAINRNGEALYAELSHLVIFSAEAFWRTRSAPPPAP